MHSRKPWRLAGAVAAALVLATACGSGSDSASGGSAETRVFEADNGKVTIPVEPQRVVATGYAVPVLIEAKAKLVGISSWKRGLPLMSEDDRKTYDGLTKVAGERAADTNYEAVAKADPDLIVIGVPKPALADLDLKRLESIAPVAVIGPTLPSAWRELSQRQADAAGQSGELATAKAAYEKKAADLKAKYQDALAGVKFGHVGAYGDISAGTFMREFAGSWGTNIAQDMGVAYYGEVKEKGGGAEDVSEYPSIEELPKSLGDADAITYTVEADGKPAAEVKYVLDSKLWKNLPAVKDGKAYPVRYTEAATYESAMRTLDEVDKALAPLLGQ
ncbi:ABC transporter substrate-binding protein [Actinomadura livida]|uniref:Iron complex transport system substrate-binding protein n=1 Tax=Actinomadura livida TaxID=79909 RepID=A0A7W7IIT0_9ACTN|nr:MULTISPECIES: ABC transporter substrate-binding protein [Actinomadura]MBB4777896.1 iron complex transport system substrate-binding protein [Actinomadura catellatispora]GGT97928.1 ABC transporter substrate-binding protein [Actinomadura livida]